MMNKKRTNKQGFTLVELIVVITIVGILACILVPSIINYVRKAQRKADIVTARLIGNQVTMLLAEDEKFYKSFYSKNSDRCCYKNVKIGNEVYNFYSLARCDGARDCKDTQTTIGSGVYLAGDGWEYTAKSYVYVQERLNENKTLFTGGEHHLFIPMRSRFYECPEDESNQYRYGEHADPKEKKGYCRTDRWVVGYSVWDGEGRPEVWAGNSKGKGANGPRVRLWPAPPSYY